ncbi:MAG: winged helix-turn-helix transcriptional regulator [Thermoplasmata archaeon]|nr:MAG: winged helix-turn-helix transcriptional regulator [Thermoplasmata archaeon]
MARKAKLDKIDRKIIELLKENSRMTISDITREIKDLTESTIRYRLENLDQEGYIKNYTVVLDSKKFEKNISVIFNLKVLPEHIDKAIEYLRELGTLSSVYLTTGTYPIVVIGYFKNQKEITEFITKKLKNVPLVDYDVAQILKKERETHYWA